jgi:hypothetical protein
MVFEGRNDSAVIAPKQTRAGHEVPPRPALIRPVAGPIRTKRLIIALGLDRSSIVGRWAEPACWPHGVQWRTRQAHQ